jgi:hypothetical protein
VWQVCQLSKQEVKEQLIKLKKKAGRDSGQQKALKIQMKEGDTAAAAAAAGAAGAAGRSRVEACDAAASAADSSGAQTESSDDDSEDAEWTPRADAFRQQQPSLRPRRQLQLPAAMDFAGQVASPGCNSEQSPAARSSAAGQQPRSRPAYPGLPGSTRSCSQHNKTMSLNSPPPGSGAGR